MVIGGVFQQVQLEGEKNRLNRAMYKSVDVRGVVCVETYASDFYFYTSDDMQLNFCGVGDL